MFALGLLARLAYVLLVDEPILYTSQYFYLFGALRIVEDPDPLRLVATSDEWRLWGGHWTIAPLYYLFVAGLLKVFGAALLPVQVVQCVLGALGAVAVGVLGREAAGPRGAWAGAAYALYWPSVEMSRRLLTENLHVVRVVWALALLARGSRRLARGEVAAGGALLGLSALARSVSLVFVPLAAWLARPPRGSRRRWALPAAVLLAAVAAILPWSARNLLGTGSLAPIETVGAYNLLKDNAYERLRRYQGDFFFE
ncbi:MAG TPA: glycosyltransferase family 39 protein, partial [Vicinamibacteria bacterium]|nr:glycosyltransferase family 39 protein [Vicinamibacteria bacterium]